MNKLLFQIGVILCIAGAIWISFLFLDGNRTSEELILEELNSVNIKLDLIGNDIGYYKILIPNFDKDEIYLQILDSNKNIISEHSIQTKLSVGYFDYQNGTYLVKVTNISEEPVALQIEFGNTNSKKMIPAGIIILVGVIMIIVFSFIRLKNYKIAHPDENIS